MSFQVHLFTNADLGCLKMNGNGSDAERMGNESVPNLVMSCFFSTFAALLFNSLYTVIDALFVSRAVGDNAMGGISLILPFVIFQSAISTAVGSGAASVVSRALGENSPEKAGNAAYNAMLAFYSSAILITIFGFVTMKPMLNLLGVTPELYESAKQYYMIILAGNIFSTGFSSIIRAEGKMKYALLIWVIPVSVNIILDAVFIIVLGWGVIGSALATVICQMTSASMSLFFFKRLTSLDFSKKKLSKSLLKEILLVGFPSVIQMGTLSVLTFAINNILSDISGTDGVNSFAYIGKILTFAVVPFTAFSMTLSPIAGYNIGSKNKSRVIKVFEFCYGACLAYSIIAAVLLFLFAEPLVGVFTKSELMIETSANGLKAVSFALPFSFSHLLAASLFQAQGKRLSPFVLYSVLPVAVFLITKPMAGTFGPSGVWTAYVLSNLISTGVSVVMLCVSLKRGAKKNMT